MTDASVHVFLLSFVDCFLFFPHDSLVGTEGGSRTALLPLCILGRMAQYGQVPSSDSGDGL